MFSQETPVADYFRLAYVPDKLPGDGHAKSRDEYTIQLRKLNRYFARWLAELNQSPRDLVLGDFSDELVKFAMQGEVLPRDQGGRGNSAGTANKLYRHVRAVWDHAWAKDLVPRRCRTKAYRELKREPRAWLPDQVEKIVAAAYTMPGTVGNGGVKACDFWLAHTLVGGSLGVRISAQMSIPTLNWDPERGEILVPAEGQKQRADQVFSLFTSANQALVRLAPHERAQKLLFGDWPYDPDRGWRVLRKHLRRLLVRAGLFGKVSDVTRRDLFHKFRKTVATEIAIKKGLAAACEYLGHSSEQVTLTYIDKRRIERVKIGDVVEDPGRVISQLRLFGEAS
jgi:integrase